MPNQMEQAGGINGYGRIGGIAQIQGEPLDGRPGGAAVCAFFVVNVIASENGIRPEQMQIAGGINGSRRPDGIARNPGESLVRRPVVSPIRAPLGIYLIVSGRVITPEYMQSSGRSDGKDRADRRAGGPGEPPDR